MPRADPASARLATQRPFVLPGAPIQDRVICGVCLTSPLAVRAQSLQNDGATARFAEALQ